MHTVRVLHIPHFLPFGILTMFIYIYFVVHVPLGFVMVVVNIFIFKDNRYRVKYCFYKNFIHFSIINKQTGTNDMEYYFVR